MPVTRVKPSLRFIEFSREEIEQSIAERFEKQVRKNPFHIAVHTDHVQITYDALNRSANRLAWGLLQRCPDDGPVAIIMQHDAPAVVAIFGALKAGKIFILLDPALPDARIGQILKDSGAHLIVTNDQSLGAASDLVEDSRRIYNVDRCGDLSVDNLNLKISPDRIGYILYTSGSTGRPKGVIRTHRNDLHNIRNRTNCFCISDDDRITLLGSYSTGQGMTDICCALLNGATLYPRNLKTEGFNGLADWLLREKITVYHSAATLFRHFVVELGNEVIFPELRVVRLGGEPVSWRDVALYKEHCSENCVLANELSCSETNTVSQFLVDRQTEINVTVPVGYPVEDKDIMILDEQGDQLGLGRVGEIAVRSRFLSPGYWNRPDLTEAAFTRDRESPDFRIYRTGDLGRKAADGCLEHLGRNDARVKIHGFRVECYEVELALLQNPSIDQAFVTHRQDNRDQTALIAYLVCRQGMTLTINEVRADLKRRLPDYMLPTAFLFLDFLPLTPTGKIDRRALPEPDASRPPLDDPLVEPEGEIEESVAQLCAQTLGVPVVGVHDNLFDLGGSSISAMQIVAGIMKTFRVNVPVERFYESPTVAGLSAVIATACVPMAETKDTETSRAQREGDLPLSFSQERLWFLEQWEGGKATYNLCHADHLEGPLSVRALEESLNAVIARHEALRTTFVTHDDRICQTITPVLRLLLARVDLHHLSEAERIATSLRLAEDDARRPFDLAQGPLVRALVLELGPDEHVFVLTVNQIVCDGWSMRILLSELWTLYEAISQGKTISLQALTGHYADFAVWQRQLLSAERLEPQLAFWKKTLAGALPVLNLPTDHARPALQSFRGSRLPFAVPAPLTQALNELSRQEGVSLFITLLAAFKTLLNRYTGQEDLIVGFPVADRLWGEATTSIGFFVNTLVARTDLSGRPNFRDYLLRVREMCHSAYAHQDLPFEKLVEVLRPPRDLSRNPLFQAMFNFQNLPPARLVPPELRCTPINIDNGTSKVDLTLSLAEQNGQLSGFFEYCTDLFDHGTIERMADRFQNLLEDIVTDRNQRLEELSFLTASERYQLAMEWNDNRAEYPDASCIHELFEAQAQATPEALAVEDGNKKLTFRDLAGRANQLARYLRRLGVGPEAVVGICMERSVDMVVGLLGILKSGGAYLPLDPSYPPQRIAFMLDDALVSVVVTKQRILDGALHAAFGSRRLLVCLDRKRSAIDGESADPPSVETWADGLAYVMYTSGSMGVPKGVAGVHRAAVNRFAWMWNSYPFQAHEKCCVNTSLSFVDSVWEIFGPLLRGIPSVLISEDVVKDTERLMETLRGHHVTRISLVPSLLKSLLEAHPFLKDQLPELTLWSCSGEVLSKEVVVQFRKSMPDATLLNLYGCTEVSADATFYDTLWADSNRDIPIGRPLSNNQIYILDNNLQLLPAGIAGELYIGGDGLARGYFKRPELTAEKFVPNPFSREPRARLYRTGDLARYLPDGNIAYLGRIDNQVKIRGYRIELKEIETMLVQHPAVKGSLIVARDRDSSADKELVAYLVLFQEPVISVSELRRFLQEKLPDYMVPSLFVFLDALPVTPNGKLDRNALPLPDGGRAQLGNPFVDPRTEIEKIVAQVWREVLKLKKVGVYDNFFDLGGHSLLATRIVARLRNLFHVDLLLRKIFELPTVAELAQQIDLLRGKKANVSGPPIVPVARGGPLPLSFSQQRLWFLQKLDPGLTAYNMSATFEIRGALNVSALEQALSGMVARHEVLRTRIIEVDGQPFQEIIPTINVALPVVELAALPHEQANSVIERYAAEDARQPYNLSEAPLMRAKLLRFDDENYVLILNFNHLISDGPSLVVYYQELAVLYASCLEKKPSALPELSLQYADYAVWQNGWLKSEACAAQLNYWKQQLGGNLAPLNLPGDYERPVVQSYRGARKSVFLPEQLTKSLNDLSRQEGVTLFMTLLSALSILFSRHSGQEDVVVGSTIAGRSRQDTEGLIGFFINALPLRVDLSGDPTFVDLLKRVREMSLDAFTHQDLPFEKVVEVLNPARDLSRNPIFNVIFNMADTSVRVLSLAGCEVTRLAHTEPSAKFDIVIHAPIVDRKTQLVMVYNADLFAEWRIGALLDQLIYLLSQAAAHPQKPISDYCLATPSAAKALPDPTASLDDAWEGAIHELIAKQARRAPESVAVVERSDRWTYGELDRRSNQLANYLIANGVKPKDSVAIYAYRGSSLVVALMGVLKAGGVFTILDPAYPAERLVSYLRIAQPKGWVEMEGAGEPSGEVLRCVETIGVVCRLILAQDKDHMSVVLQQYSESKPAIEIKANDPAYIAFTSGSTGEPKGVLCRHGPITHFLPWQTKAFGLREDDRFALLSGLAYNHLHRDVFTPLAMGASLCVPPGEIVREPEALYEWLRTNSITVLHLTPALGQLLLTGGDNTLPAVRWIFFGGDVLTQGAVAKIRARAPNATIGCFYGATETQRAVGYYEIPPDFATTDVDVNRPIPLGCGIENVQLLLLNKSGKLAGVGELADLYVRSPHLAEGYVGDEVRTKEMFVTNPFTNDSHDRLYKTGELGRYLHDGNVEWAGRNDRRVSVRGFRVELGEIEAILKQHPTVKDAAVVLQDYEISSPEDSKLETRNQKLNQRLVAYVAADEAGYSMADLLRSYVSTRLPDYMVPTHFVILEQLPLSPNGKVNYQALPQVERSRGGRGESFGAPRNALEATLCAIFAEILGREEVGIGDNFFRIGGHSLLAAQAAARIRETFGVSLELRSFFASPTVAGLSEQVTRLGPIRQTTPQPTNDEREEFEL